MKNFINIDSMKKILSPEERTIFLKKFIIHDPIEDQNFSRFIGTISQEFMCMYAKIYTKEEKLSLLKILDIEEEEDLTLIKMQKKINDPMGSEHFGMNEFHMMHIISTIVKQISLIVDYNEEKVQDLKEATIICKDFGYKNTAITLHSAAKIYPQKENGEISCLQLKTFYNNLYLSLMGD